MSEEPPASSAPQREGGIGAPIRRREDERFVTGRGRYIGDVSVADALHVVFVRSPHAHARIVDIDASAALSLPGVVAVWTGADLVKAATTLRMAPPIEGLQPVDLPPFPVDKVRFAGDLVTCVVAATRAAAVDAAEAVAVAYEELPAVPDIAAARDPASAPVDPEHRSNRVSHQTFAVGDLDAAFAGAARIVEARFSQHRQTHAPLEPRGCGSRRRRSR
jgi:carbon-monoxide dehydrogenase large subunit